MCRFRSSVWNAGTGAATWIIRWHSAEPLSQHFLYIARHVRLAHTHLLHYWVFKCWFRSSVSRVTAEPKLPRHGASWSTTYAFHFKTDISYSYIHLTCLRNLFAFVHIRYCAAMFDSTRLVSGLLPDWDSTSATPEDLAMACLVVRQVVISSSLCAAGAPVRCSSLHQSPTWTSHLRNLNSSATWLKQRVSHCQRCGRLTNVPIYVRQYYAK